MQKKPTLNLRLAIPAHAERRQQSDRNKRQGMWNCVLSVAALALLAACFNAGVHAQTPAAKSSGSTASQPFVDCGHPFDAENPNINTKPCVNVGTPSETAPGNGNGAQAPGPDQDEFTSELQEQCAMMGITLERACEGMPTAKAKQQCTAQAQKKVSSCENAGLGGSQGGSSMPGGSPDASTLTASQTQAVCNGNYQKNLSYCKTIPDAKTAAACRALSADTFQRCSQAN